MREKHGRYLRYGVYLLIVFLFLFVTYSFSRVREKKDELEVPLPRENDTRQQNEIAEKKEEREERPEENPVLEADSQLFLGVYGEQMAIFARDLSGTFILKEVLPYPVKKVYYDELIQGIPFSTEKEKLLLLENYTS
ncbi:MAG: hypothetical protein C4554_02935 [Dethiobacter sp.]|jgi:Ca2+/Na+ antiporter|nr:MAG: hypothetical protein C4554_02935 [Dethiobacter sp.]